MNSSNKLTRGFTLFEVLMVLVIIGIISVTGSGYYTNIVKDLDLSVVAENIIFDLKAAQAKAMTGESGERWGVCFRNPSSGSDVYEIVSPASTCTESGSSTVKTTVYLQGATVFEVPAAGTTVSVVFNKITGATQSAVDQTIRIVLNNQPRTITITPIGRIY
ncbi:MAG: hypothetical protein A3B23_03030 [Candidatus Colwellbacteria bacterium RIFCSPLOWO2_01_FULL_48_10]|uniref:General secretion pathway GspH domain-containing protein n=2 Tax=Bacteria candidate phyla TaxID=1783234 RepID=A0A1F5P209_9BACT|nr:MAG: hypothetical protein A2846_00845 [Candidatus Doudnabacteria bacterium RIFCSPHIGHO2_01_FULL_49_9]OGY60041.1 MAG: hypothetical protein A3B23_03030 [Candidatus Colwellbacteria bacterium RIFCSPLOWO2_01_FULL_48_10]